MSHSEKMPLSAANAHGAVTCERLHCGAHEDFTHSAIEAALHLTMTAVLNAHCLLMRGDAAASLVAAHEASRAIGAAVDSLSAWVR